MDYNIKIYILINGFSENNFITKRIFKQLTSITQVNLVKKKTF
jgi:hypothetical protein